MDMGGAAMILSLMEKHAMSSAGVAKTGCSALCNLIVSNENSIIIRDLGGIAMVLSVMEKYGASRADVVEAGCIALSNFAVNEDNQEIIKDSGGIDLALKSAVRESGSSALRKMIDRKNLDWDEFAASISDVIGDDPQPPTSTDDDDYSYSSDSSSD
jgi:hypothetical protein